VVLLIVVLVQLAVIGILLLSVILLAHSDSYKPRLVLLFLLCVHWGCANISQIQKCIQKFRQICPELPKMARSWIWQSAS